MTVKGNGEVKSKAVTLSMTAFAREFGYGEDRITKLAKTGALRAAMVNVRGQKRQELDVAKAVEIMKMIDMGKKEKANKDHYDGLLKKLEYEREIGKVVDWEEINALFTDIVHVFNQSLELLPDRMASVGAEKGEVELRQLLRGEVDVLRKELITGIEGVKELSV